MTDPVSEVCRALAHPTRRGLLLAMANSECDVGNLTDGCGLDQPTASKHLAALRAAGLVHVRVDGRRRCYSLVDRELVLEVLDLVEHLGATALEHADA